MDGIDIPITFGGASQATSAIDALADSLDEGADAAKKLEREQERSMRGMIEMTGRAAAAASQIAAFGRIIENETVEALGNLAARSAQSAQQFAALGSAAGPQGALVGGIVGAVLPAFAEYIAAENEAREAMEARVAAIRDREIPAIDDIIASLAREAEAREQLARIQAGRGSVDELRAYAEQERLRVDQAGELVVEYNEQLRVLENQLDEARRLGDVFGALDIQEQITQVTAARDRTRETRDAARAEARARLEATEEAEKLEASLARQLGLQDNITAAAIAGNEAIQAGKHAATSGDVPDQSRADRDATYLAQRAYDEEQRLAALRNEAEQRAIDDAARRRAEDLARREEHARDIARIEREQIEASQRAAEEAWERQARARERAQQEVLDSEQRLVAEREALLTEYAGRALEIGTEVTHIIGEAVGEIILGTKSSEEAFMGMLKSFLELISEQAALSAAREFAEAIASFARYDYGGGAAHTAAGVAFTAVAIATGVGAAAIVPAPAAQAPSSPTRSEDRGRGGSEITILWNAPVFTSGQRAEMGRELGGLIRDAEMAA